MPIGTVKLGDAIAFYYLTPVESFPIPPDPRSVKDGFVWSHGGMSVTKEMARAALLKRTIPRGFFANNKRLTEVERDRVFQVLSNWLDGRELNV